jgi:oxygen-independent coproporphyrinogen-3 oxidase
MKSLYLHIPFCEKKCFYCSFVVSVGQGGRSGSYLAALAREAEGYRGAGVASVYVGGGTPSCLSGEEIRALFRDVVGCFAVRPGAEITFEANPENLSEEKLEALRMGGVNRLSLGAQTFDEKYLRELGRNHNAGTIRKAYQLAVRAGFENINLDLMFGFPEQERTQLINDIHDLTGLGPRHVSLYSLDIEPNSRFHARRIYLPPPEVRADFYKMVCGRLESAGYEQYEISNFAREKGASEHNINYWRCGEYIGLGTGAHSFLDGRRFWNTPRLTGYIRNMEAGESAVIGEEILTVEQRAKEKLLFGLRMNAGVSVRQLRDDYPRVMDDDYLKLIGQFVDSGHLVFDGEVLRTSMKGRLVLDEIAARLI